MPSRLIFSRTCLTRSAPPEALTWASKSFIEFPFQGTLSPLLAPRERTVGSWMQLALGETREAERLQEIARPAADILGHEMADADHLIAVVRVGNHIDVVAETVEYRKIVGCKGTDAPGGLLFKLRQFALESLLAEGEGRAPHTGEILADDKIRGRGSVRIDLHLGGIGFYLERHGAA